MTDPVVFNDRDPGPEIRRKLNLMGADFAYAVDNAVGPQGWAPVVAVVTDGARRVLQITDWTGGEGSKPTVTGFIGATGIVATAALAVDIRGSIGATGPSNTLAIGTVTSAASPSATITGASPSQTLNLVLPKGDKGDTGNTGPTNTLTIGTVTTGAASATITGTAPAQVLNLVVPQGIQGLQGIQGPKGDTGLQGIQGPKGDTGSQGIQGLAGLHGWTPKFAVVTDGTRRVQQVVDWFGGTGSKPATGEYVGATGLVATAALAVDIRGPAGAGTGNVNPTGTIAANDLAAFADSTGEVIKALKAADLPVSTATQTALDAKQPADADLTAIAALAGTSGLLKKTAADTWTLDTTAYSTLTLGSTAGAALAASGSAGADTTAAKSDHVHPFPTAADVGAVAASGGTASGLTLNYGYTEEVFAVTGTAPALSPTNGSIQTWVLTGNSTPTAGTWASGQSMTLMVDDGSAYTINWASMSITWKTGGGTAPTLLTTGYTVIELAKVGSTIYGWLAGDA